MSTMNISLPESMKQYVEQRTVDGEYSTASEYIRELIRSDHDKHALLAKIFQGMESPMLAEDTFDYLRTLRGATGERG
ncbi:MAG: type II toxin-antitoxin system ParD family antitoxin [Ancrocorticia sp.]|uniref:type II toxin-antitoxin system ParD family antitoxin n=1 Tax=Ancrocorticia sp. TaxID=2593684 RepID=UPI003F9321DE